MTKPVLSPDPAPAGVRVRAGQVYRSQKGLLVKIEQVRGVNGDGGAYAVTREITRGGAYARGDRGGVPRDLPGHVPLAWFGPSRALEPRMPVGYELVEDEK